MQSPILFLIFNRPDSTRKVFEAIRNARPPRLYISADGPRESRADEDARCEAARRIATQVDWPCEIKTLFRFKNLGCKMGVSEGISWFFEHEAEGVILEDDVVPLPGFFEYCDTLLELYRNDNSIFMVSGCNQISDHYTPEYSYFFSRYCQIWGWATWRRAWNLYDVNIKAWPVWRDSGGMKMISGGNIPFETYWGAIFNRVYSGKIDTWDYQWTFTCWMNNGLTAVSSSNQTQNIGFGSDSTHTFEEALGRTFPVPSALNFPLTHPPEVSWQRDADNIASKRVYAITWANLISQGIKRMPAIYSALVIVRNSAKAITSFLK